MKLSEFMPESELCLDAHIPIKSAFPVFDAHSHWGRLLLGDDFADKYDTAEVVAALRDKGLCGVTNLDGEWGDNLLRMLEKTASAGDFIKTFGSADLSDVDRPDFESFTWKTLRDSRAAGISGLKFWKIVGLSIKDRAGRYITPDDARIKCVWQAAGELGLPVTFHIADPTAFFKPIDRYNERYEELGAHPDWAFNAPGLYSFTGLMEMQERMIAENPKTTFIIAHVGSYSENLAAVGRWLGKYPNMYVDIAERIGELGRQPYTAHDFFVRYADRILFGTDSYPTRTADYYNTYFRFLETKDEYFRYDPSPNGNQGRWRIYGLGLPKKVLKNVYYENARRILGL